MRRRFTTTITLQGVTLRLCSNNQEFDQYVKTYFGPMCSNKVDADIEVSLHWRESLCKYIRDYEFDYMERLIRVGRRIWIGPHEVIWSDIPHGGGFKISFRYFQKTKLEAYYNLTSSKFFMKRFYKQIVRKSRFNRYKQDIYESLIYHLVYFPIMYDLERRDMFPMHASGVVFRQNAILIPGLPGVGKSTLSLALTAYKGSKFISDNIVLYDSDKIYSLFEPIKLDRKSISLIPQVSRCLEEIGVNSYYGRKAYTVKGERTQATAAPDVLIVPCRAKETKIEPIGGATAVQLIADFNRIAGEVNSYFTYSSVQNMCFKKAERDEQRRKVLENLVGRTKSYLLYINPIDPIASVIKEIERTIDKKDV